MEFWGYVLRMNYHNIYISIRVPAIRSIGIVIQFHYQLNIYVFTCFFELLFIQQIGIAVLVSVDKHKR